MVWFTELTTHLHIEPMFRMSYSSNHPTHTPSWSGQLCLSTFYIQKSEGRHSAVGIATRFWLDGPGIESRWGARFSAHVQTGLAAHLASYTMGIGSLPVV
jgi:hypothetical protein